MSTPTDRYRGVPPGVDGPYTNGIAVTPDDGQMLPAVCRGVYVGVAGDLAVLLRDDAPGGAVTFKAVPAGSVLPIWVKQVLATGTTATSILGLY